MTANIGSPNYYQVNAQVNQRLDHIQAQIEQGVIESKGAEALINLYNELNQGITNLNVSFKQSHSEDRQSIGGIIRCLENTLRRVQMLFLLRQNKMQLDNDVNSLAEQLSSVRVNTCAVTNCKLPPNINSRFCSHKHEMQFFFDQSQFFH